MQLLLIMQSFTLLLIQYLWIEVFAFFQFKSPMVEHQKFFAAGGNPLRN